MHCVAERKLAHKADENSPAETLLALQTTPPLNHVPSNHTHCHELLEEKKVKKLSLNVQISTTMKENIMKTSSMHLNHSNIKCQCEQYDLINELVQKKKVAKKAK